MELTVFHTNIFGEILYYFEILRLSGIFGAWTSGLDALTKTVENLRVILDNTLAVFLTILTSFTSRNVQMSPFEHPLVTIFI